MKREDNWVLYFCNPSDWTVNLTPPEGDWDREVEPGSEEEKVFIAEKYKYYTDLFFRQVGKNLRTYAEAVQMNFEHAAAVMASHFNHIQHIEDIKRELTEHEEAKNGTYTVRSQKVGIELPKRKVNCGPPLRRLDKRRK